LNSLLSGKVNLRLFSAVDPIQQGYVARDAKSAFDEVLHLALCLFSIGEKPSESIFREPIAGFEKITTSLDRQSKCYQAVTAASLQTATF
jgi:hypothetical protein